MGALNVPAHSAYWPQQNRPNPAAWSHPNQVSVPRVNGCGSNSADVVLSAVPRRIGARLHDRHATQMTIPVATDPLVLTAQQKPASGEPPLASVERLFYDLFIGGC